ncbi:motility protein A [Clostridia bacterium]|nr:motility protein A [Clostridia bacterium]
MDLATIGGLVVGVAAVLIGMMFKGVPLTALNNPAAFFIILAGTVGAVVIAFPLNELKTLPKLFGILMKNQKYDTTEVIHQLVGYAELVRKEGILALEPKISEVTNPFLQRGLRMVTDGCALEFIEEVMIEDLTAMETRHSARASMFSQAGTYAPTLGVLGAVLGLIAAMSHMDDTEALGHAISAAFIATLLGIFTGYVLWHPFANKLKRKSKQEAVYKNIIIEGVLGLADGTNPRMLLEKMLSYLPAQEKLAFAEGGRDRG